MPVLSRLLFGALLWGAGTSVLARPADVYTYSEQVLESPAMPSAAVGAHISGTSSTHFVAGVSKGRAPRRMVVAAVGDISLGRDVNTWMAQSGPDYPFEHVLQLLDADITVGNLEGPLTTASVPWTKGHTFVTPPNLAGGLSLAGFDVLTLANNHAMDFGAEGLLETVATLDSLGIASSGAGANLNLALEPAIAELGDLRVAFLSFVLTPTEWRGFSICSWGAQPNAPGVALGSADAIATSVRDAAVENDFVVVLLHAGTEYATAVDQTQQWLVDAALEAGADAVIGAHSHVVQPLTWTGPGEPLVAWGLGNFVFDLDPVDLANIPEPRVSLVLRMTLEEGVGVVGWEADAVALHATEDRPIPATAAEQNVIDATLASWPPPLGNSVRCP